MLEYFFIFVLGLVAGSFLSAFTYRYPRNISIALGRSFCDKCKAKIAWYDNLPLLSFLLLKGKCRNCGKKISPRYPFIELSTALAFSLIAFFLNNCTTTLQGQSFKGEVLCIWQGYLGFWALPFLLFLVLALITIFVIDLENQLIPDNQVYLLFSLTTLLLLLSSSDNLYQRLMTGFAASTFLLLIHLVTRGRGMGLGDVKFALLGGVFLGWPGSLTWLFSSFLIGAFVGVILILFKKASFGKKIPFGPFLTFSLFINMLWGNLLFKLLTIWL